MSVIDMTGKTCGHLRVIKRTGDRGRLAKWLCQCSCGRLYVAVGARLRNGTSIRCKCCIREVREAKRARRSDFHPLVHSLYSPTNEADMEDDIREAIEAQS